MSATATAGVVLKETPLIRVRCEAVGTGRDCRILDLNPNGAFIESFVPLTTGSRVKLRFCLPNGHPVSVDGLVNYHQFKVGFGVEFSDLSGVDLDQICSFMG
jgi:hypothetical protein